MADNQMQILNADCEPIGGGRLYGAGEIIERSVLGNCYLVGGSIGFCVASGIQLGRQVAALEDWDA